MHIVIPGRQDTAMTNGNDTDPVQCILDWAEQEFECAKCDTQILGWRHWVSIRETDEYIYRLKAWANPFGHRKIVLRVRKKRSDGRPGMERLVYKRSNGKIIF